MRFALPSRASLFRGWMWKISLILFITVVFATSCLWRKRQQKKLRTAAGLAKQVACRTVSPDDTIFVSVASYRDPECHLTVFDCLEKAHCPLRVYIGVCQQNYPVDVDTMQGYLRLAQSRGSGDYHDQIRVYAVDAGQAQGPMFARSLIEQHLYRGERYYLIVDSHTLFTPGWDVRAIDTLRQCPSPRPVLTMYPDNFQSRSSNKASSFGTALQPPSFLRFKQFNKRTGLPEVEGPLCKHRPAQPLPSLFWGACFSFAEADMMRRVPYDPHCPYVFLGEEIAMAARLYTHGYDLFGPTDMLVRHMWKRQRPTFWEQFGGTGKVHRHRQALEHKGYRRLRHLFGLQALQEGDLALGPYGLGTVRSLADYQRYCGIDFLLETVEPRTRQGLTASPSTAETMAKLGTTVGP